MYECRTVQITQRSRILRRIHDRMCCRRRVKSAQHSQIPFVVTTHHHRFDGVLNMVHESRPIVFLRSIMVKMVSFGIGDNRDFRMIFGKASIGFVGFRHKHIALACMASVKYHAILALDGSANGITWISQISLTGMGENMGEHGTGRGFAMGSRNRYRTFRIHQQRKNVAAVHDAFARRMRCDDFRIVRLDGTGKNNSLFAFDVFLALPEFDGNAKPLQTIGFGAGLAIRAIHLHTLLMQHLGKYTHARSSDADEMGGPQIVHAFLLAE